MPNGPGRLGPGAPAVGPIAPTHRPRWLLVLSSITLMYGGTLLISGLGDLRSPTSAAKIPLAQTQQRPLAPEQEALEREVIEVGEAIVARHARAIRMHAAASAALALILLYSAAAALSRDRHGRTATLLAAWLAIAYQLGSLPVTLPIAQDYAVNASPVLARWLTASLPMPVAESPPATDAGAAVPQAPAASREPPLRPEVDASTLHWVVAAEPIVRAILGILVSLLLITYFGGRRGRALYGLPPRHPPPRR